jgi:hypothetical protein
MPGIRTALNVFFFVVALVGLSLACASSEAGIFGSRSRVVVRSRPQVVAVRQPVIVRQQRAAVIVPSHQFVAPTVVVPHSQAIIIAP